MVDRLEIDALLISALYGELTPTDEARLNAHLESHPADRTALADLTRARSALLESRILTVQLEPPQSVSALLLQEAARRAPKPVAARSEEREGWFQRFVRSFAARPMMAAAAMLVVLLGVAGTIKMTGEKAAEVERAERTIEPPSPSDPSPAIASETASGTAGTDGDSYGRATVRQQGSGSFDVTLNDESGARTGVKADSKPANQAKAGEKADTSSITVNGKLANKNEGRTYLELSPPAPKKPKDLDEDGLDDQKQRERQVVGIAADKEKKPSPAPDASKDSTNAPGVGGVTNNANEPTTGDVVRGRTPPVTTLPPQAPMGRFEEGKEEDLSAARTAHNDVVAAAKAGDCVKASKLAADLATRAPGYYQTQVHTDRELKSCIARINAERETRERTQRAAPKRTDERANDRSKPASRK